MKSDMKPPPPAGQAPYHLKRGFRDMADYAQWVKSNCGKCVRQKSGEAYGCYLLKCLDKAITSDWYIPREVQLQIGFSDENSNVSPDQAHWIEPDKCGQFESRLQRKQKPKEEKAP